MVRLNTDFPLKLRCFIVTTQFCICLYTWASIHLLVYLESIVKTPTKSHEIFRKNNLTSLDLTYGSSEKSADGNFSGGRSDFQHSKIIVFSFKN